MHFRIDLITRAASARWLHDRVVELAAAPWRAALHLLPGSFGSDHIQWELHQDQDRASLAAVLYRGRKRRVVFGEVGGSNWWSDSNCCAMRNRHRPHILRRGQTAKSATTLGRSTRDWGLRRPSCLNGSNRSRFFRTSGERPDIRAGSVP
jgi:hypothetical protein